MHGVPDEVQNSGTNSVHQILRQKGCATGPTAPEQYTEAADVTRTSALLQGLPAPQMGVPLASSEAAEFGAVPLLAAEVALAAVTRMAGTAGRAVLRQLPAVTSAMAAGGGAQVCTDRRHRRYKSRVVIITVIMKIAALC